MCVHILNVNSLQNEQKHHKRFEVHQEVLDAKLRPESGVLGADEPIVTQKTERFEILGGHTIFSKAYYTY